MEVAVIRCLLLPVLPPFHPLQVEELRKELERKEQEGEKETGLGKEYEEVMEEKWSVIVMVQLH